MTAKLDYKAREAKINKRETTSHLQRAVIAIDPTLTYQRKCLLPNLNAILLEGHPRI